MYESTTRAITIERNSEQDLEGITQTKLAANANAADEIKQVDWVVSQQPDVLLVDNMLAAHGREPFTGPRKIAVAMGEAHVSSYLARKG